MIAVMHAVLRRHDSYDVDPFGPWLRQRVRKYLLSGEVLALLALSETALRTLGSGVTTQFAVALALVALTTTLPVTFLRPVPATFVVWAAAVVSLALFNTFTLAGIAALLHILHRFGVDPPVPPRARVLCTGFAVPFLGLALLGRPTTPGFGNLTVALATLVTAAVWSGIAHGQRMETLYLRLIRDNESGALLELTARGERARIARELHDVVAHHISMVAVQAETARLTTPGMPGLGAQRLTAIGDTARAALTEMRRLLGVLREDAETAADLRPQPGLAQLVELLDETRDASGAATRLIVSGQLVPLDPGVELAAYRIVQEALTNVRRHAPGAATDVELRLADGVLWLRIRDNGPGPPVASTATGHGLAGMRERATAVGGSLRAGAARNGGFLVEATLPATAAGDP